MNDVIFAPTPFQERVLTLPDEVSTVFLGGGRGGGKSFATVFMAVQHAQRFGANAAILYVRNSFAGLRDAERNFLQVLKAAWPDTTHNLKEMTFRLPNGATIELGQITTVQQSFATKYQGRSFTLVIVDEAGAWPDGSVEDALRSCLRAPKDVPTRLVISANPGGAGHLHLLKRYVRQLPPWTIASLPGIADCIVHCPSTYRDNTALNQEQYARALEQSTANDPGRQAAWIDGNWERALSDLYFAHHFDEDRNVIPEFHAWPPAGKPFLSLDWGSARPAACGLFSMFPRGYALDALIIPPKSLVLMDEVTTVTGEGLNVGSGATIEEVSLEVVKMWSDWDLPGQPFGVADDAMFHRPGGRGTASMADQFKSGGVILRPAAKGRRNWEPMKTALANAGVSRTQPGLFFTPRADYALQTIPFIPRDPRRPEDLATGSFDHMADVCRYALIGSGVAARASVTKRIGTYRGDGHAAYFAKLDREIAFANEAKRRAMIG